MHMVPKQASRPGNPPNRLRPGVIAPPRPQNFPTAIHTVVAAPWGHILDCFLDLRICNKDADQIDHLLQSRCDAAGMDWKAMKSLLTL
jgi:hypothetical protein